MKNLLMLITSAFIVMTLGFTVPANAQNDGPWVVMEFIGAKDVDRANEYAVWMHKVAARHGVDFRTYQVTGTMQGEAFSDVTFAMIIKLPNQAAFQEVLDDPEYMADPLKRAEIWDFSRLTMHRASPIITDPAIK